MITNRVMRLGRHYKIAGNDCCALMKKLIECVLTICSRFTPNDWSCCIIYFISASVYVLSIALHIALLEVGRESMHVLIIRQYSFAFVIPEIAVPDANQRHDHRYIFF